MDPLIVVEKTGKDNVLFTLAFLKCCRQNIPLCNIQKRSIFYRSGNDGDPLRNNENMDKQITLFFNQTMRGNTHIPESTITNMMTATALRDLTFIDLTPVSKELQRPVKRIDQASKNFGYTRLVSAFTTLGCDGIVNLDTADQVCDNFAREEVAYVDSGMSGWGVSNQWLVDNLQEDVRLNKCVRWRGQNCQSYPEFVFGGIKRDVLQKIGFSKSYYLPELMNHIAEENKQNGVTHGFIDQNPHSQQINITPINDTSLLMNVENLINSTRFFYQLIQSALLLNFGLKKNIQNRDFIEFALNNFGSQKRQKIQYSRCILVQLLKPNEDLDYVITPGEIKEYFINYMKFLESQQARGGQQSINNNKIFSFYIAKTLKSSCLTELIQNRYFGII